MHYCFSNPNLKTHFTHPRHLTPTRATMTWMDVVPFKLSFSCTDVAYESDSQPVATTAHSDTDTEGNSGLYAVKMYLP